MTFARLAGDSLVYKGIIWAFFIEFARLEMQVLLRCFLRCQDINFIFNRWNI